MMVNVDVDEVRTTTTGPEHEVRSLLSKRLPALEPRPWTVRLALNDGPPIVVDCVRRALSDAPPGDAPVHCEIAVSARDLSKIASGEMNMRFGLLYSSVKVDGSVSTATQFGDWLAGNQYATSLPVPSSAYPRPTMEYSVAWTHLRDFGYAIIEGALGPERLEAVRTRTIEQAAAEAEAGCADFVGVGSGDQPPPVQRIWSLINKGSEFMGLLDHPLIDEFVFTSVGEDCCLGGFWCLIAGPGSGTTESAFHTDQLGLYPPIHGQIGLNVAFCLDDFTEANGATRVLPGSHLPQNRIAPDNPFSYEGMVALEAPAGSALLFDSRLWHNTGPNRTDTKRHGLFLFFNRQWMRPIENPYLSTHPSVVEKMSDRIKTLYGLRHTNNLGRVGGSRMGDLVRYAPDELVLDMRPSVPPAGL